MTALFLDHEHSLTFTKLSMSVKLSDSPDAWQREIASEIYKQVPFLGEYAVNVILERVDADRGFGFGSAIVTNKSGAPLPDQQKLPTLRIPVIIKERMLAPFDVFMDGDGVYPLSEKRVREKLFRAETFEASTRKPTDKGLTDQLYPPIRSNMGMGSVGDASGMGKYAGEERGPMPHRQPVGGVRKRLRDTAEQQKIDKAKEKTANEAEAGRRANIQRMKSEAAANPTHLAGVGNPSMGPEKKASLLETIAPTVPEADVDEFINQVLSDPALKTAAMKNPRFANMILKMAAAPGASVTKTAEELVDRIKPTVVQLQKLSSGDFLVKWANVDAFQPQEGVVPPQQANAMAGTDVSNMQPGQTMTVGTEKAKKQQLQEEGFTKVDEPGAYKVQNIGSGEELVGYVLPITDFEQQPLELYVFVSPGGFAVQDEIAGQRQEGGAPPPVVPVDQAQGSGALVFDTNGKLHSLLPMTVQNTSQDPTGELQLHAENLFGEPLILTIAAGLQAIQQIGENEYAVPDFVQWLPLPGEPIDLAKQPIDVDQAKQTKEMPSAVSVGSSGAGEFSMDGPPLAKVAREQKQFIKRAQAEFLLVTMGVNPFEAREVLKYAEERHKVKVAGLKAITPLHEVHKEMVKKAAQTLSNFPYHLRKNLVKEAAVLEDGDTADKVLSLNFLNPENINTFASYLPELDSTAQKLAETLVASRLGMREVDEGALERSIRGVESVIDGLRSLQQGEAPL